MTIKDITTKYNTSLAAISRRFSIPYRTVQNWSAGVNKCPEYVLYMIDEILSKEDFCDIVNEAHEHVKR